MKIWIAVMAMVVLAPASGEVPWSDRKWPMRIRIAVANPADEALDAFPVAIRLGPATPGWSKMRKSALRFVAADGKTVLPHEVAWWNPDRGAEVHVRVARIPGGVGCEICMYFGYGKPSVGDPVAVWSAGYVAVYHLAQTQGKYLDSVGRYHSVVERVGSRDNELGPGGRPAPFFNGKQEAGELIDLGQWNVESNQMSLEAYFMTYEQKDRRLISKSKGGDDDDHTWMLNVWDTQLRYRQKTVDTERTWTGRIVAANATQVEIETWYHGAGTYDGEHMRLYQDGLQVGIARKGGPVAQEGLSIHLGNNPGYADQHFWGLIDEVRISRVGRSAAWVAATSATLHGTMCTLGPVEDRPDVERPVDPGQRNKDAAALLAKARELERAGAWLEAMAAYARCAEQAGTPTVDVAKVEVYRVMRESAYAAAEAQDRRANGARRLLEAAVALRKAEKVEEAEEALDALLAEFPTSTQAEPARKLLAELRRGGGK